MELPNVDDGRIIGAEMVEPTPDNPNRYVDVTVRLPATSMRIVMGDYVRVKSLVEG